MTSNSPRENEQRPHSRRVTRARGAGGPPKRVTLLLSLAVFLFIVSIPAYGYYSVYIAPMREPIVKVNDKVFTMGVYIGSQKVGEGTGPSKQEAEVTAAEAALKEGTWKQFV